MNELIGL